MKYPWGIIEDILIKADKFIFLVDFMIMDLDEDVYVPFILGRSFLPTSQAIIDNNDGHLVSRVGEEEVDFKLPKTMKNPQEFDDV